METHLLHTFVTASRRLSLYRVTKRVKITSVPWKLHHKKGAPSIITQEDIFCVNMDKYGYDKALIGTGEGVYLVDKKTHKTKALVKEGRISYIADFKDLTFFFFHSDSPVKIYTEESEGVFKPKATLPQISLHGLTIGVSNYGGNVQRVKDTMYNLQEENKTLVRLDLNRIRELIFGGLENVSSAMQTINNTVNCFSVSKLVRSQVYYVKGLNELWLNDNS